MSLETALNPVSRCKRIELKINDLVYPNDYITNIEFAHDLFKSYVQCTVSFNDVYNMRNSPDVKFDENTKIRLTVFDFFEERKIWNFVLVDMKYTVESKASSQITIVCIDEVSHKLMNSYIAKSFKSTAVDAFSKCFNELKCNELLQKSKLTLESKPTGESDGFVIPANRTVLDFFTDRLRLDNVLIYQDNYKYYVKEFKLNDIKSNFPMELNGEKIVYTNKTTNTYYAFYAHDFKKYDLSLSTALIASPMQKITRFKGKEIIHETVNLSDFYSDMMLNNNDALKSMQTSEGSIFNIENATVGAQKYDLFKQFIQNERIDLLVVGSVKYNNVGYIINVALDDGSSFEQSRISGDVTNSGKYLITKVHTKFIGDSMIQKLTASRFDAPKARNI